MATRVRLIVDELLDGRTVEAFVCACYTPTPSDADPNEGDNDCPGGVTTSATGADCPNNPEADSPADDQGRFLDVNADGVPDDAVILANVMSVVCNTGTNGAFVEVATTAGSTGFYNPSGNQQVPNVDVPDLSKLGPAIVLDLPELQPEATCRVELPANSPVRDKDNNQIPAIDATKTFGVAKFHLVDSSPAKGAMDVLVIKPDSDPAAPNPLVFIGNASVKGDSLAGNVTLVKVEGGTPITGTVTATANEIIFVPDAPLEYATQYTFTAGAGILSALGDKAIDLSNELGTVTFTTEAAPEGP